MAWQGHWLGQWPGGWLGQVGAAAVILPPGKVTADVEVLSGMSCTVTVGMSSDVAVRSGMSSDVEVE